MTPARSPSRALLAGLLLAVALLALGRAGLLPGTARGMGGAVPEGSPGVVVRDAALRRTETAWLLDARVDIELPPVIRAGLDSGVPLEFVATLSLRERRPFRPDRRLLRAERRYRLAYYELTRHYRVLALDDGADGLGARNYRSLRTALEGLGTLRGVPLAGSGPLADVAVTGTDIAGPDRAGAGGGDGGGGDHGVRDEPSRPLAARLTLALDARALPLPLQSPFGSAWRLPDGVREWTPSAAELAATGPRGGRT